MYKVCLVAFCMVFCQGTKAQTSNFFSKESVAYEGDAINIVVSSLDKEDGNSYFAQGERHEHSGDLKEALNFFGKAAFEYNSSREFNSYGEALLRLSNIHLLLAHYSEAEQVVLKIALKNYTRIKNRGGQMNSYGQLGKIYFAENKLTQSLWFYTQQGILAKQLKDNNSYIDSILGIALVNVKKKEYKLAMKDVDRAELFAKNTNVNHFRNQIKEARDAISVLLDYKK